MNNPATLGRSTGFHEKVIFVKSSLKKSLRKPGTQKTNRVRRSFPCAGQRWVSGSLSLRQKLLGPQISSLGFFSRFPGFLSAPSLQKRTKVTKKINNTPASVRALFCGGYAVQRAAGQDGEFGTTLRFSNLRTDVCPPTLDLQHALAA